MLLYLTGACYRTCQKSPPSLLSDIGKVVDSDLQSVVRPLFASNCHPRCTKVCFSSCHSGRWHWVTHATLFLRGIIFLCGYYKLLTLMDHFHMSRNVTWSMNQWPMNIHIMNVYECNGTHIFMRWKMKCSIQRGEAELNGTFHLSPHENICSIARMKKHYLFYITAKSIFFSKTKPTMISHNSLQPWEIVDSSCMACIQRTRYMNLLYALTTALRHDTHLATAYFSTKKRQPCNSSKRMGPKMHGKWNRIARQMTIIIE